MIKRTTLICLLFLSVFTKPAYTKSYNKVDIDFYTYRHTEYSENFNSRLNIRYDKILANGLLLSDWLQTRRYSSRHTILGKNPSNDKINLYFTGSIFAYNIADYLVHKKYKNKLTKLINVFEISVISNNVKLGATFNF